MNNMRAVVVLLTGCCLNPGAMAAEAFHFDQAQCATYFVGSWQVYTPYTDPNGVSLGGHAWDIVFAADGHFDLKSTVYAEGSPDAQVTTDKGTWSAKAAAAANACEVSLTGAEKPLTVTYTVTGPDSFMDGDTSGTRAKAP